MGDCGRLRRRRRRLWESDPRCRLCKIETVLPEDVPEGRRNHLTPHMATIDHLDSRHSEKRGSFFGKINPATGMSVERTILACWKCNNETNRLEEASLPPEVLRERSNMGHA